MGRERGNYNLCGCASSMKLRWYIIIQPPGLCGVCYKGTTSTVASMPSVWLTLHSPFFTESSSVRLGTRYLICTVLGLVLDVWVLTYCVRYHFLLSSHLMPMMYLYSLRIREITIVTVLNSWPINRIA